MARDKSIPSNIVLAKEKFKYDTIQDMVNDITLKVGMVVDINGYYKPDDGATHKRVIADTDDGSGVQLRNGKWANIVHNGEVNVSWFGAKGDGVSDDSTIIQNIITYLFKTYKKGILNFDKGKTYLIGNVIYFPSNFIFNLNGTKIIGKGIGTNNIFESGYLNGDTMVSNLNSGDEIKRVINTFFNGGEATIENCNVAFNLKNFNENSCIQDILFFDCTQALRTRRPFYSSYHRLMLRMTKDIGDPEEAGFHFDKFNNICRVSQVCSINRKLGFLIEGPNGGLLLTDCSAESCIDGMKFIGGESVGPVTILNCYFEAVKRCLFFSPEGEYVQTIRNVHIENCWFFVSEDTDIIIEANYLSDSNFRGNYINGNKGKILLNKFWNQNINIDFSHTMLYENTILPELDKKIELSNGINAKRIDYIINRNGDYQIAKNINTLGTLIPQHYSGQVATLDRDGIIPFCKYEIIRGADGNYDRKIITGIDSDFSQILGFNFQANDELNSYVLYGFIFGNNVVRLDQENDKQIELSKETNGKLALTIKGFKHKDYAGNIKGIIRHL